MGDQRMELDEDLFKSHMRYIPLLMIKRALLFAMDNQKKIFIKDAFLLPLAIILKSTSTCPTPSEVKLT